MRNGKGPEVAEGRAESTHSIVRPQVLGSQNLVTPTQGVIWCNLSVIEDLGQSRLRLMPRELRLQILQIDTLLRIIILL